MGGCQNYGPPLGPLNTRCHIILRSQKGDHNFDNHPYRPRSYDSCGSSFSLRIYAQMPPGKICKALPHGALRVPFGAICYNSEQENRSYQKAM